MPRQFNVFSALVVPVPSETFDWVATTNEGNVTVSQTPSPKLPLTLPSYAVPKNGSCSATANATPGLTGTFVCNPIAPDMTTQSIVIASQNFLSFCSDVNVIGGDYFIWQNTTKDPIVIKPDEANENWWPLDGEAHTVPPNGYLTLLIPAGAKIGTYMLTVTIEGGGNACNPGPTGNGNQPKINVGDGMPKP